MSSNKPFPSSDLDVFKENSTILDQFVNSQENEHPDRFNRKRPTITGIIKEAFNVRTDISNMNETLIGQSRWDVVPKNTSLSLGGDNGALNKQAQALFNRTEMLKVHAREALRRTYQEVGLVLVPGSFEDGGKLETIADILLEEKTGKVYSWSGSFPKVVNKGTLPTSEIEFVDRSSYSLFNSDEITLNALGWSFDEDIAPFIRKAMELGYKRLLLGKGVFKNSGVLIDKETFGSMTILGHGSGVAYTPVTKIVPLNDGQEYLFKSQENIGGLDNICFENVMLDGGNKCDYGVIQLSGAGWEYKDLQLRGFRTWALWSEQGLNYYNRIYQFGTDTGSGIGLYSDFFCTNIESSGGVVGLKVLAGGGRLDNVLVNSQTGCCIELSPLNDETTHINTSLSNIYIGEVHNPNIRAQLKISGSDIQRVREVQISNIHTVSAQAVGVKHNLHISIINSDNVMLTNWSALGINDYETKDLYDHGALKIENSKGVVLSSGVITGLSKSPVRVLNSELVIASGVVFNNWGGIFAEGDDLGCVTCNDKSSVIVISDGVVFKNTRVNGTRCVKGIHDTVFKIGRLLTYGDLVAVETAINDVLYSEQKINSGDSTLQEFGRRVTYSGTVITYGDGAPVTIVSLPVIPVDQTYRVTVQQVGNPLNATLGEVFMHGEASKAVTTINTQTGTLVSVIETIGTSIVLRPGTGYGNTTWRYGVNRVL